MNDSYRSRCGARFQQELRGNILCGTIEVGGNYTFDGQLIQEVQPLTLT